MKHEIYMDYALFGRKIPKKPIFRPQNAYFHGKILFKSNKNIYKINLSAFVAVIIANCRRGSRARTP
jgi:hypothetical protein